MSLNRLRAFKVHWEVFQGDGTWKPNRWGLNRKAQAGSFTSMTARVFVQCPARRVLRETAGLLMGYGSLFQDLRCDTSEPSLARAASTSSLAKCGAFTAPSDLSPAAAFEQSFIPRQSPRGG